MIHDQRPGNLVGRFDFGWGDIAQGFRESDRIFEAHTSECLHHPMENVGVCIAEVRGDTLELTAPIQHLFRSRDEIAAWSEAKATTVHRAPITSGRASSHWELSVGAAEVEVDPETGEVTLLQYAIAADVGTAVHPVACKVTRWG